MSITITIPAELEPLILQQAKAAGKPIEEVTVELIAQGLQQQQPMLTSDEIIAPFREKIAARPLTDEELENLPSRDYLPELDSHENRKDDYFDFE